MKNKKGYVVLLLVGLLCLAGGAVSSYVTAQKASKNASENVEAAMNASSAEDAAKTISENNKMEMGSNALSKFLYGLGGVLTVGGAIVLILPVGKKKEE